MMLRSRLRQKLNKMLLSLLPRQNKMPLPLLPKSKLPLRLLLTLLPKRRLMMPAWSRPLPIKLLELKPNRLPRIRLLWLRKRRDRPLLH